MRRALLLSLTLAVTVLVHAQQDSTWRQPFDPVKVVGNVTINEGVHLVSNKRVPAIADHYAQTFRVLHGLKPDVFVAQHGTVFGLEAKAERARAGGGQTNPFVDPDGYQRFLDRSEQAYLKQLRAEQGK